MNHSREHRRTKGNPTHDTTPCSQSNSQTRATDSDYEYHMISSQKEKSKSFEPTPSSGFLIALPDANNSRKYTTYLGLVDSGSSKSLMNKKLAAKEKMQVQLQPIRWDTATGVILTQGKVEIQHCHLPQSTTKHNITAFFYLFDKHANDEYDIILGRDLLQAIGLDIHCSESNFTWDNISVAMFPSGYWTQEKISAIAKSWSGPKQEINVTEILPANYKPIDINQVTDRQTHLSPDECKQLQQVLLDFSDLFRGTCGKNNGDPVSLELVPGSTPFYGKPFLINKAYKHVTKDKIQQLQGLGLLTLVTSSQWAAPTFIIPKKNNTIRVITDFRGLNKCLVQKPDPIPKISDIFQGMEKFRWAKTIDLNMGYYSMPLDDDTKKLCVISLPWGLFQYEVLPQGIKPATDIFQQCMYAFYHDMSNVDTFLDNTMILGYDTFTVHLSNVTEVLK